MTFQPDTAPQGGPRTHQCSAAICDDGRPHSVYDCPHMGAAGEGCENCIIPGKWITVGRWETLRKMMPTEQEIDEMSRVVREAHERVEQRYKPSWWQRFLEAW